MNSDANKEVTPPFQLLVSFLIVLTARNRLSDATGPGSCRYFTRQLIKCLSIDGLL